MDFGDLLDELRSARGLTYTDLGRLVHLAPKTVRDFRNGRRYASTAYVVALDCALGADGALVEAAAGAAVTARRDSERLTELLCGTPSPHPDNFTEEADRLAVAYLSTPAIEMVEGVTMVRRRVIAALGPTRKRSAVLDLTRAAGRLSGVLAYAAVDLGDADGALVHAQAAWAAADAAGDDELRAWVRGTQSLISRFDGRYVKALRYAEDGLRYARHGSGHVRLLCGVAQCAANLDDPPEAHKALLAAELARDAVTEPDGPGVYAFSEAKQAYYSGSSLVWLDGREDLERARAEALRAIELWQSAPAGERSDDDEALAHVYAATAAARLGDLEQVGEFLAPILDLPEDRRISWIRKRMTRVAEILEAPPYEREPAAREIAERIRQYR